MSELKPIAWLHNKDGRVDIVHKEVKEVWEKIGKPANFCREIVACKTENYTIPLYQIPEGYALVPVEPTIRMKNAAWYEYDKVAELDAYPDAKTIYTAMITAAIEEGE